MSNAANAWTMPLIDAAKGWSFAEMNAEHAALGLAHHVEAMAFRGATLADMLDVAVRSTVVVVDDAPVSSVQATVRPGR